MDRLIFGKGKKTVGKPPAVALVNPKYSRNVSQVVRACSCFGINQLWISGNRVQMEIENRTRLPREERMKGYSEVDIIQYDYFFDQFPDTVPIGVEVMEGAEILSDFEHPENALYVFGPEDGGLTQRERRHCHRFVFIPMRHCANLAASVYMVLYDRLLKKIWNGKEKAMSVNEVLAEPRGWAKFEELYGNSEKSFKNISLEEIHEGKL